MVRPEQVLSFRASRRRRRSIPPVGGARRLAKVRSRLLLLRPRASLLRRPRARTGGSDARRHRDGQRMPGALARPTPGRQTPSAYSSSRKSSISAAGSSCASAPASAAATAFTGSGVAAVTARPATTAAGSAGANRASAAARPSSERLGGASMRPVARAPRTTSSRGNRAGPCRRTSARSVPSRSTTPRTVGTNPSDSVTSPLRWTNTSSRVKSCDAAGGSSAGGSAQRRVAMAVAVSTSITVEAITWLSGIPMDECTRRLMRNSGHSRGGNLLTKALRGLCVGKCRTRHPFRFAAERQRYSTRLQRRVHRHWIFAHPSVL